MNRGFTLLLLSMVGSVPALGQTTHAGPFPQFAYSVMDSVEALDAGAKTEWKERARSEIRSDPSSPIPLLELGYLYLEQGVDRAAWTYFEKALEIDESFAPAHFALAEWTQQAGDLESTIANLRRAQELDPEAIPVRYALGKALLKGTPSDQELGLDLLEGVALESPGYRGVLEDVDRILRSDTPRHAIFAAEMASRFPKNERVLRLSAQPGIVVDATEGSSLLEDDARRAYNEATALLRGNQLEEGTKAYIHVLSQSPPSVLESIKKDIVSFFGEEHLERAVASRNSDLGRGILDLWMNDDPTPTTVGNEVLAEFYKRLEEVRRRFGMPIGDLGYDDRGRVWLRLGTPDERFQGPGPPRFYPNETWLYRNVSGQRLLLNFVSWNNAGFRFAGSLGEAIPTWTRDEYGEIKGRWEDLAIQPVMRDLEQFFIPRAAMDPVYFEIIHELLAPARRGVPKQNLLEDLPHYDGYTSSSSVATALSSAQVQLAEPNEKVQIAVHAVSFENGADYTTWVLLGYPLEELTPSIDSSGSYVYTINKEATVFRSDGSVAFTREAQSTARTPTKVESPDLVTVDGFEFVPPPGEYRLGVRVQDVNSDLVGLYKLPLNLAEIEKSALRLSDIVLADRIEPVGDQARFSRNGLQIVPSPTRTFDRARAIWLYFEAYPPNDRLNEPHNYQVEVRVKSSDRRASITQQVFRGLGRLLGREGGNEITVAYEREFGAGTPVYETLSLDASGLAEGIYQLDITVIDLNAGESATKSTEFAVHN